MNLNTAKRIDAQGYDPRPRDPQTYRANKRYFRTRMARQDRIDARAEAKSDDFRFINFKGMELFNADDNMAFDL